MHTISVLTISESAEELGVHPNTIKNIIKAGLLKYSRTKPKTGHIRIKREYLNEYLKRSTRGGEAYGK